MMLERINHMTHTQHTVKTQHNTHRTHYGISEHNNTLKSNQRRVNPFMTWMIDSEALTRARALKSHTHGRVFCAQCKQSFCFDYAVCAHKHNIFNPLQHYCLDCAVSLYHVLVFPNADEHNKICNRRVKIAQNERIGRLNHSD